MGELKGRRGEPTAANNSDESFLQLERPKKSRLSSLAQNAAKSMSEAAVDGAKSYMEDQAAGMAQNFVDGKHAMDGKSWMDGFGSAPKLFEGKQAKEPSGHVMEAYTDMEDR